MKGQWEKEECMVEWETYRACVLVTPFSHSSALSWLNLHSLLLFAIKCSLCGIELHCTMFLGGDITCSH